MIDRRARAPVPRALARRAISRIALVGEFELGAVVVEEHLVLLRQGVLGLGQDPRQVVLGKLVEGGDDREPADQLGDHAEPLEVLGRDLGHQLVALELAVVRSLVAAAEADHLPAQPLADDLLEADERPAADEQDVGRVDLEVLLLGVLAAPLGRDVGDGPLEQLQEGLLDALARDVAGDRDVLAGLADLVDLVDVDDPALGGGDVEVGRPDELEDQVLDVLADVAGLGQRGGVADGERDVEPPGQGLGQRRLAAAGRADQEDVALGDLDVLERRVVDLARP